MFVACSSRFRCVLFACWTDSRKQTNAECNTNPKSERKTNAEVFPGSRQESFHKHSRCTIYYILSRGPLKLSSHSSETLVFGMYPYHGPDGLAPLLQALNPHDPRSPAAVGTLAYEPRSIFRASIGTLKGAITESPHNVDSSAYVPHVS